MKIKFLILSAVGILLLGLFLRLINLNILPVFADESIYIRWSQVMKAESTLRFLPLSDGKQPLFMWLVIPFFKFINDPLVAGRAVSVLAGLGTMIGISSATFLIFRNHKTALTSGLIWAVLPYSVFFDRLALADGLLVMFVVWTFVFSFLSFQLLRWDFSMLAGFSLGFAWLTKSPAVFSFALIPTLFLLVDSFQSNFKKKILVYSGLIITTYFIAFAMYNILRLGPEFHMIAIRNKDYIHPLSQVLSHPLDPLTSHLRDAFDFLIRLATPVGLGLILLGLYEGGRKHLWPRLVLASWWLGPILAQAFIAKTFTARYIFFTIPFAVILMSHGIWHFGDRTNKHFLSLAVMILFTISSLGFDYFLLFSPQNAPLPRIERSGYLEEWTAGQGIKEVSEIIVRQSAGGPVVVGSEGYFGTPFSALEMYFNPYPQIRVVGIGTGIQYPDAKLVSATKDNQVFVVANSTRIKDDPEKLGYEILKAYPKEARPDGSREFLLFMKLK